MFKKVFLAIALAMSASFATWDYYPIPDSSHGSVEAGLYYDWDHAWSQAGLKMGARFTMIKSLEIAFTGWGYQFWNEEDCSGCDSYTSADSPDDPLIALHGNFTDQCPVGRCHCH